MSRSTRPTTVIGSPEPLPSRWPPPVLANAGVLIGLGLLAIVSVLVMGLVTETMTKHGASSADFEYAGTSAKAQRILDGYGAAGKHAAWWQLVLDIPFMISYALLLCAGCWFAARRLGSAGALRLSRLAFAATVLGPIAAGCDLIQNVALGFVLSGHAGQPAPRISEVFGYLTFFFAILAGAVFIGGSLIASRARSTRRHLVLEQP